MLGWSQAHVVGLPGCFAAAAASGAALEGLFTAIPAYWAWLQDHGTPAPGPDDLGEVTLGVIEIVGDGVPGAGALFAYEQEPPTAQSIATCLERLAYSRADLLALLAGQPAGRLAPGPAGSLGGILAHLAATDRAYTRLLGPAPRRAPGAGPLARLAQTRAALVAAIRALPAADHGRIFVRGTERWTLRKLLRRLIEHEREQTARVAALLAGAAPFVENPDIIVDNFPAFVENSHPGVDNPEGAE